MGFPTDQISKTFFLAINYLRSLLQVQYFHKDGFRAKQQKELSYVLMQLKLYLLLYDTPLGAERLAKALCYERRIVTIDSIAGILTTLEDKMSSRMQVEINHLSMHYGIDNRDKLAFFTKCVRVLSRVTCKDYFKSLPYPINAN